MSYTSWFQWEDDEDGTKVLINLDQASVINFNMDNDGNRTVAVAMGDRIASTKDPDVIDRLLIVVGHDLDEPTEDPTWQPPF